MAVLGFLLRVVRFPFDVVSLTFDLVRLGVWLARRRVRRMLGKRRKTWGPFCESPKTVSSGAQACPVVWKYGTLRVFRLLCPDCRTTSAGERYCGAVEDDRQQRRHVSLFRLLTLGGALTAFWLGVAGAVVVQLVEQPPAKHAKHRSVRHPSPPLGEREPPVSAQAAAVVPQRDPDGATEPRPDTPVREPAPPRYLPKPPEPRHRPEPWAPKPKTPEPDPKPKVETEPAPVESPEQARARAQELVAKGDQHLGEGRYMEALIAYSDAARRDPSNARAHLGVGQCHFRQQKRPREAQAAFEQALRLDASLVEARVSLCRLALSVHDYERATKHALEVKRLRPGAPESFMLVSACHEARGDLAAASQEVSAALALDGVTADTCLVAGELYLRHNDLAKAEDAYRRAISLGADRKIAGVGLARVLRRQGKLGLARQELDAVLKQDLQHLDAAAELAEVLVAQGEVEAAVQVFEVLAHRDPERHESRARLAQLLLAVGRTDDAVVAAQRVLHAQSGNVTGHVVLAEALLAGGIYTMARDHCEQALHADADNVHARMLLARCHAAKERHDLVVRELKALLAIDARHLDAQLLLGRTYQTLGQLDNARECFQTTAKHHPESPGPPLGLGDVQLRRGFPEVAMLCYEDARRLGPDSPVATSRLAVALLDHGGDTDRAYRLAEELKTRFPTDPIAWDTYGWACYRRGQYSEAVKSLSIAARKLPDQATVRYHYGAALHRAGEISRAKAELGAALKLSDEFPGADKAKKMLAEIEGNANDE